MLERLNASRIKTVLRSCRRIYLQHQFAQELTKARADGATDETLRLMIRRHKVQLWAQRVCDHGRDEKTARCMLVRNRWQLLWRLHQQPYFRKWRQDARLKKELAKKQELKALERAMGVKPAPHAPLVQDVIEGDDVVVTPPVPLTDADEGGSAMSAAEAERLRDEVAQLKKKLAQLETVDAGVVKNAL